MSQRAPGTHGEPRLYKLAAAAALVALVVATVAVIVVARRPHDRVATDEESRSGSQGVRADANLDDALLATITRLGATTFAVPPSTVDAWLAEPTRITRGVTGARRVHEPAGLAIDGVRPGSVAAALGLESGDVIRGINGTEVSDPAAIAPLIARSTGQVSLDLRRGDATVIINIRIGR